MAFIAMRSASDGTPQTLGVVCAVADPDNVHAEFAIVVRSDLKRRGLGPPADAEDDRLPEGRGTQRMVGHVMPENAALRERA